MPTWKNQEWTVYEYEDGPESEIHSQTVSGLAKMGIGIRFSGEFQGYVVELTEVGAMIGFHPDPKQCAIFAATISNMVRDWSQESIMEMDENLQQEIKFVRLQMNMNLPMESTDDYG